MTKQEAFNNLAAAFKAYLEYEPDIEFIFDQLEQEAFRGE
jgi:hypothetical protein